MWRRSYSGDDPFVPCFGVSANFAGFCLRGWTVNIPCLAPSVVGVSVNSVDVFFRECAVSRPCLKVFHCLDRLFVEMCRLGPLVGFPVNLAGVLSPGMGRLCPLVVVCVISVGVLPSGVDRCAPWLGLPLIQ